MKYPRRVRRKSPFAPALKIYICSYGAWSVSLTQLCRASLPAVRWPCFNRVATLLGKLFAIGCAADASASLDRRFDSTRSTMGATAAGLKAAANLFAVFWANRAHMV